MTATQSTYTTAGRQGGTLEHWIQWSTGREIGETRPAWGIWTACKGPDSVIEGGEWTHLADAEIVRYDPEDPDDDRLVEPTEVPDDVLAAVAAHLGVDEVTARLDAGGDDGFGGRYFAIDVV